MKLSSLSISDCRAFCLWKSTAPSRLAIDFLTVENIAILLYAQGRRIRQVQNQKIFFESLGILKQRSNTFGRFK